MTDHAVLVAGGGPTGLMPARELALAVDQMPVPGLPIRPWSGVRGTA